MRCWAAMRLNNLQYQTQVCPAGAINLLHAVAEPMRRRPRTRYIKLPLCCLGCHTLTWRVGPIMDRRQSLRLSLHGRCSATGQPGRTSRQDKQRIQYYTCAIQTREIRSRAAPNKGDRRARWALVSTGLLPAPACCKISVD